MTRKAKKAGYIQGAVLQDVTEAAYYRDAAGKWKAYPWYRALSDMTTRVYDPKFHERYPTYKDCTLADEWHRASTFKQWFDAHYIDGWALDKDILTPHNKHYSEETCVFVPQSINKFLTDSEAARGAYVQGVRLLSGKGAFHPKPYQARVRINGARKTKALSTEADAFAWYVEQKRSLVPALIAPYRDQLDPRVEAGIHANLDDMEARGWEFIATKYSIKAKPVQLSLVVDNADEGCIGITEENDDE